MHYPLDLFFTSQPTLVTDFGVHSSLHVNYHHEIMFAKFNLEVYFPPLYKRVVWYYMTAHTDHTRNTLYGFNWDKSLANKDVNEMINVFNGTISNVLCNYIPHETIICDIHTLTLRIYFKKCHI